MGVDKTPDGGHTKRFVSAETRAKMSIAQKAQWAEPGFRAKMSVAHKKRWAKPEEHEKQSSASKIRSRLPGYLEGRLAATHCFYCGNNQIDELRKIHTDLRKSFFQCREDSSCGDIGR